MSGINGAARSTGGDEEAGREARRLALVFDAMLEGVAYCRMIFDDAGAPVDFEYLSVNPAFATLTGLEEVVGRRVTDVIPGIRESDPDLFEVYGRVARGGMPEHFEVRLEVLGMDLDVSAICPEPDHFVAIFEDVSRRKAIERELRDSVARLSGYFEQSAVGVAVTSPEKGWLDVNQATCELLGRSREELESMTWAELTHPDDVAADTELFDQVIAGEIDAYRVEKRFLRSDGQTVHVDLAVSCLRRDDGSVGSFLAMLSDISGRVHAEEQVRTEHRRLEQVVDAIPLSIGIVAPDGRVLQLNATTRAMWGDDPRPGAVDEYDRYKAWWPATGERLAADDWTTARAIAGGEAVIDEEIEIERFDGEHRFIRSTTTPVLDDEGAITAWVGVTEDITGRVLAERALRASEERYHSMFDHTPVPVWEEDFSGVARRFEELRASGIGDLAAHFAAEPDVALACVREARMVRANRAGMEFFGLDPDDDPPANLSPYFTEDSAGFVIAEMMALASGAAHFGSDVPLYDSSGDPRLVGLELFVAPGHERTLDRVMVTFSDLTQRVSREYEVRSRNEELEWRVADRTRELSAALEEVADANRDLVRANIELGRANAAKAGFLANVSHELRTPLNSIIGFTGILVSEAPGPLNDEQRKQMAMVRGSADHLLSLIDDLLDLTRIEAHGLQPDLLEIEVAPFAEAVVDSMRGAADAHGLQLDCVVEPAVGFLSSDPRYLRQILLNLLGNAVKFTDEGGVGMRVSCEGDEISFAVADTGRGIELDQLERVFDEFYQAPSMAEAKSLGTGLGLALSQRLARLLGGRIVVASTPGSGSTFTLRLPVDPGGTH